MTISDALKRAEASIDRLDAQFLLANLLNTGRASLIAHSDRPLSETDEAAYMLQVADRAKGTPVAYLIGTREFYGRNFRVSPATLIPRPETELLVEQALVRLMEQNGPEKLAPARVLDMGTGTGAVAISLALEDDFSITATDISPDALEVARSNATALGAVVEYVQSNWFSELAERKFDLIVSNPPYISGGDSHLSQGDLRFEPQVALTDNSDDGLASICAIVAGASRHLAPGGWLLFEHGYDQAAAARELLLKAGFVDLICVRDLAGIERVSGGQIR